MGCTGKHVLGVECLREEHPTCKESLDHFEVNTWHVGTLEGRRVVWRYPHGWIGPAGSMGHPDGITGPHEVTSDDQAPRGQAARVER